MTIMNSNIREELTDLLAEHLLSAHIQRVINSRTFANSKEYWLQVADEAMDFIYGDENGNVSQPECSPYQEIPTDTRSEVQWSGDLTSCCGGFPCGCCFGGVDSLEGGPVAEPSVTFGVMTQEPLRASFVFPDHPSLTGEYVRLRESGSWLKAQSSPEPDSTVA